MLIDALMTAMESGLPVSEYRYVGMGANRFYDFIMIYKYLGISDMVSIERDQGMFRRATFNKPFQFIRVLNSTVHDFLLDDLYSGNTIYWLDYDGAIHPNITTDIYSLGTKARAGDFVFVTLAGVTPGRLGHSPSVDRLADLKDIYGDLANGLVREDVEDATFHVAAYKIVSSAFTNAFGARSDGVFRPFFRVRYADAMEMVSFGGIFCDDEGSKVFLDLLLRKLPFLDPAAMDGLMFRIGKFDLTEKEKRLFDLAVTAHRSNAKEINALVRLGFDHDDLRRYHQLLRYHPRYVETLI